MQKTLHESVLPEKKSALTVMPWEEINSPGAYVEVSTGDLFRIPQEALVKGTSPLIGKTSRGASRFAKVSDNPYILIETARRVCADTTSNQTSNVAQRRSPARCYDLALVNGYCNPKLVQDQPALLEYGPYER